MEAHHKAYSLWLVDSVLLLGSYVITQDFIWQSFRYRIAEAQMPPSKPELSLYTWVGMVELVSCTSGRVTSLERGITEPKGVLYCQLGSS